jgi:hypothetical protein
MWLQVFRVFSMKNKLLIAFSIILIILISIFAVNYLLLQQKMNDVLAQDARNDGIKVSVRFAGFVNYKELNYNITDISDNSSSLDVTRVLLQFAEKVQDRNFNKVYLAADGKTKFYLKGDYFKTIGEEYEFQNPIYTLRTMPENVYNLDGSNAFDKWEGGIFGVTNRQMSDLNDFCQQWFIQELIGK